MRSSLFDGPFTLARVVLRQGFPGSKHLGLRSGVVRIVGGGSPSRRERGGPITPMYTGTLGNGTCSRLLVPVSCRRGRQPASGARARS